MKLSTKVYKTEENNKIKLIWSFPWNYKEGFIFAFGFLILGFLMEIVNPLHHYTPPRYPYNLTYVAILVILTIAASTLWRNKPIVVWLSSIKSSIPAIILFAFQVFLLAVIPQKQTEIPIGLRIITRTWYFTLSALYLTITLGFAIAKRIYPFNFANTAFTLNHLGLWLCVVAGLLGYGDKQEVKMQVSVNQLVWYGINDKGKDVELSIAIRLEKFIAEYYTPKPALMVRGVETPILPKNHPDISIDSTFSIEGVNVKVHQYYQRAYISDSGFIDARGVPFTGPAALVEVSTKNGQSAKGWIAPECASFAERYLTINEDTILRLLPAEPKYYASDILLYTKRGIAEQKHRIEVNSPLKVDGWFIYQYGYDNRAGADSGFSIFLAVYDPWLNVVYAGMLMILFGTILMSFNFFKK